MKNKIRLDQRVLMVLPDYSRQHIQSLIMQGKVRYNGVIMLKAGSPVPIDAVITVDTSEEKFVSRAGHKLEHALQTFSIDVTGLIALDAGLSTGGFTDCLLQHGANKVYGVDVGYGQVHEKIRRDQRVCVMERTNLRHGVVLEELVDIITLDLSFISVLKVLPAVTALLKPSGKLIILIKPQFEAQREDIGRGGIIRDSAIHQRVIEQVQAGVISHGYSVHGIIESPITGTMGNKEFLAYCEIS